MKMGRIFEVRAGCPKLGQDVRSLGRMSEVREHYPTQTTVGCEPVKRDCLQDSTNFAFDYYQFIR